MDKGIEALIADMKAAALRATPGVWEMEGENIWYFEGGYTRHLLYAFQGDDVGDHQDDLNTRYIAAVSPANVLELIAALEQAQQLNQRYAQRELARIRPSVIEGLSRHGEAGWEIEEYMQQWDKEHPLELAAYKAELESAPHHNGMMQISNELAGMKRKFVELPDEISIETATIIAWGLGCAGDIGKIFKAGYDRCRDEISKQQNQQNEPNK